MRLFYIDQKFRLKQNTKVIFTIKAIRYTTDKKQYFVLDTLNASVANNFPTLLTTLEINNLIRSGRLIPQGMTYQQHKNKICCSMGI